MKYLIDSHIFIWWLKDNEKLSASVRLIIENPQNTILVSTATLWEITIKTKQKRLDFDISSLSLILDDNSFTELSIDQRYLETFYKLPDIHKDPFDRMMISQAKVLDIPFITSDKKIMKYDLAIIKN